jgi:hypothetical protein
MNKKTPLTALQTALRFNENFYRLIYIQSKEVLNCKIDT